MAKQVSEGGKVANDQTMEPGWPPMAAKRQPARKVRQAAVRLVGADGDVVARARALIRVRIAEALQAVHRLPSDRPRGLKSCMPTPVRDAYEIFAAAVANDGQWNSGAMIRLGASADDVRLVDELLEWIAPLDVFTRRLLAARAQRVPWKVLCKADALGRKEWQLKQLYAEAIDQILCRLLR